MNTSSFETHVVQLTKSLSETLNHQSLSTMKTKSEIIAAALSRDPEFQTPATKKNK